MKTPINITQRESGILQLLKTGLSNKKISEKTGISENTVKFHLKKIYKKLHAKNRVDAINKFNKIST